MKNNQKGITLVALVITIIVLLILAGVTIASLTGNNGLMTKGTKAVDENAIGKAKEQVTNSFNTAMAELYDVKFVSNTLGTKTAQDFLKSGMVTNAFNLDALGKEIKPISLDDLNGEKVEGVGKAAKDLLKAYKDKIEVDKAPKGLDEPNTAAEAEKEAEKLLK